jgi:hypothetical protein
MQLVRSQKYSNMMVFNYLSNHSNPYTLLLDSGGSDHDFSNPAFKFNVRPNPDADVPIKTIMGTYFCKEICTVPFLGRAGSNDAGNLNIISLGKLQETPNIEIESDKKISLVKITFTLLNLTLTFKFGDSRILLADGKPLADAIHEYKDLCEQRGLNMLDSLDSAISIDQLLDPNFNDDLQNKMSMVMRNLYFEPLAPPMNASYAGFKIDKSEFVTKRSILIAQRARDLMNKCGSFGDNKFADSVSNGSINMVKPMPLNIIRNTKKILGIDPNYLDGVYQHPTNFPTIAEERVDITVTEAMMEVDILIDEDVQLLISVISPGAYILANDVTSKEGKELEQVINNHIKFYKKCNIDIKKVYADGERGLVAIQNKIDDSFLFNLPRGTKPSLIDATIKALKMHVRAYRSRLSEKLNGFPTGGILNSSLYFNVISFKNLLSSDHNPYGTSPHKCIFKEPINIEAVALHHPLELVKVPREDLTAKLTSTFKTVYALALYPSQVHSFIGKWWFLNLETLELIERKFGTSVPMTDAILKRIKEAVKNKSSKLYVKARLSKKDKKNLPAQVSHEPDIVPLGEPISFPHEGVDLLPEYYPIPDPLANVDQGVPMNTRLVNDFDAETQAASVRIDKYGCVSYNHLSHGEIFNLNYHISQEIFKGSIQIPAEKAMKLHPNETLAALSKEIEGMVKKMVWKGVHRKKLPFSVRNQIIRSSAFIKIKKDQVTKQQKFKARIVTDGSQQDRTLYDVTDISSPTVKLSSIFTLATIAAALGLIVQTSDVQQAYLNAEMPNDVFVKLTPLVSKILAEDHPQFAQFLDKKDQILVKLNKAQYGCIESAKLWYKTISSVMIKSGYQVNSYDQCIFQKVNDDGNRIYVAIYVDDLFIVSSNQLLIDELNTTLEKEFGALSNTTGKNHTYLGMQFDFNIDKRVNISMAEYLKEIVTDNDVQKVAETPAAESIFCVSETATLLDDDARDHFHTTVAKLLYAAVRVRPDILLPIIFLSSRVTKATTQDSKKLRRVLRYLKGCYDLGINLGPDQDGTLRVHMFADASFGVHPDAKSHTGIFLSLGLGPILCKSVKQRIVTKSSTEAELVALSDATSLAMFQMLFMQSLGFEFQPVIMHQDNMSTISMAKNGYSTSDRTKHIKIRFFFIKQFLDSGEFEIEHCPTDIMLADLLTKPLQGQKFLAMRDKLLGRPTN